MPHTSYRSGTTRLWCAALWLLLAGGAALGDVTTPDRTGLVAQPRKVEVVRGGSVTIPMVAAYARQSALEYSIFEAMLPKHGTLGEVVRTATGAAVVYTSSADSDATTDVFQYRARTIDGTKLYSSGTTVTVTIIEPKPELEFPMRLDFDRVPKEGSAVRELMVRNVGTGPYESTISVPPPFSFEGGAETVLRVPSGGVASITVRFEPGNSVKVIDYDWSVDPTNPLVKVRLLGRGFAPFSVSVAKVKFAIDRETWKRRAVLQVDNPGTEPISLKIETPARVDAEPAGTVEIPAGKKLGIALSIPSIDVGEFAGTMVLSEASHRVEIPMSAAAAPAKVAVIEPGPGDPLVFDGEFGEVIATSVKLENTGGQLAYISASASPPFTVVEGDQGRPLKPNEVLNYRVELRPDRIGAWQDRLRIEGGDRPVVIVLESNITLPPGMEPPKPPPPKQPGERRPGSIPISLLVNGEAANRVQNNTIPIIESVNPGKVTEETVEFSWRHPANGDWSYLIETEVHRIDEMTGVPKPVWIELDDEFAEVSNDGKRGRAKIKGLSPGGKYVFRVLTIDGDSYSPPGRRLTFITEAEARPFAWLSIGKVSFAAAAVLLLVVLWKRARAEQAAYG